MKRKIILIDEVKCNGCGLCINGCPEGAIELVNGKAKLTKEFYCDGLGACIGTCPQGAITIEEREAAPYNEIEVIEKIATKGKGEIEKHLKHLKEHGETEYLNEAIEWLKNNKIDFSFEIEKNTSNIACNCPGTKVMFFEETEKYDDTENTKLKSSLRQWPVQLHLVSPQAPYFKEADLLISADCTPFAMANFHSELLRNKVLIIFCPKLDDSHMQYVEKLSEIFSINNIKSITIARMEVPCCYGINIIVQEALKHAYKQIPIKDIVITIKGKIKQINQL